MKDVVRFLGIVFLVAAIATTMACGDAGGGGGQGNNNDHPNYNPELPDSPGQGDSGTVPYERRGFTPWGDEISWDPGNECANFACWEPIVSHLSHIRLVLNMICAENDCEYVLDHADRVEGQYLVGLWDNWATRPGTSSQKGVHGASDIQKVNHPRLQGATAFPCTNIDDRGLGIAIAGYELDRIH
jgi:hypothetical protein